MPVDLKLSYQLSQADVFAGIDNLFSDEIDNVLGSDIGRYVYAGVRYYF